MSGSVSQDFFSDRDHNDDLNDGIKMSHMESTRGIAWLDIMAWQ